MQRPKLQEIGKRVLSKGWLDEKDLEELRRVLSDDWKVTLQEADFLAQLREWVPHRTPAFTSFFYEAVRNYVVKDGRISATEADWLRQIFLTDRKMDGEECRFLRELKDEVREASPEFEDLLRECVAEPQGASAQ